MLAADFDYFSLYVRESDLDKPYDSGKGFGSTTKGKPAGGMFSGRNSRDYEQLEGGHGPGRLAARRNFAWKKFAIGAVALITLVYLFGPRETPTVLGGNKAPCMSVSLPFDVCTH